MVGGGSRFGRRELALLAVAACLVLWWRFPAGAVTTLVTVGAVAVSVWSLWGAAAARRAARVADRTQAGMISPGQPIELPDDGLAPGARDRNRDHRRS